MSERAGPFPGEVPSTVSLPAESMHSAVFRDYRIRGHLQQAHTPNLLYPLQFLTQGHLSIDSPEPEEAVSNLLLGPTKHWARGSSCSCSTEASNTQLLTLWLAQCGDFHTHLNLAVKGRSHEQHSGLVSKPSSSI